MGAKKPANKRGKKSSATAKRPRSSSGRGQELSANSVACVSLLALGCVLGVLALSTHGGLVAWQTTTIAWLPFAAMAAALILLPKPRALFITAIVLVVLAALLPVLLSPPQFVGDAGEYYQMSASFANHATPDLRSSDTSGFAVAADTQGLQATGGSLVGQPLTSGYYPSRSGALFSYHFWLSALASVPFSVVLGISGIGSLKAFQVMNASLFVLAFIAILLWAELPVMQRRAFAAFWALSPALWYMGSVSAEIWSASAVVIGIVLFTRRRYAWAVFSIACGAAQNPPLIVLALLVGAIGGYQAFQAKDWRGVGLLALGFVPAALPYIFYFATFGVPNLIVATGGASSSAVTLPKALEVFFDFDQGALAYAPALMLLTVAAVVVAGFRKDWLTLSLAGASVAMAVLSAMSTNWNGGSIGLMRYAVWQLPVLLWIVVRGLGEFGSVSATAFAVLVGVQLVVFLVASFNPTFAPTYIQHGYLGRFVLDSMPSAYSPTPAVFAERTMHSEAAWTDKLPIVYRTESGLIRKVLMRSSDATGAAKYFGVGLGTIQHRMSSAGPGLYYLSVPPGAFGQ